jgi:amidase
VVDGQVAAAAIQVGRVLEQAGHTVCEAGPDVDWDALIQAWVAEGVAVAGTLLLAPREPDPARMEAVSRRFLQTAKEYSALDLLAAFNAQNLVTRSVSAFFTGYDLLITPTLGRLPAPHGALRYNDPSHTLMTWLESLAGYGPFTQVFNVTGQPAISLPLGESDDGLPIGVQIAAAYGREDLLFQIAAHLEQAMPWKDRIPPIFVGSS